MAILFLGAMTPVWATDTATATATASTAPTPGRSELKTDEAAKPDAVFYSRLLNPDTPLQERQAKFAQLETLAQSGEPGALYLVGSLYRIGNDLPASPVARDLAKARLYLSNAATRGNILAMAKMAEVEAALDHPLEAMTWAQIYGHYVMLQPQEYRPSNGYLAELVERASHGVRQSQLQGVVDHLNAFITAYDAQVRQGDYRAEVGKAKGAGSDLDPVHIPHSPLPIRPGQKAPSAGFAEYLVAFAANGRVKEVLLMDATPDLKLGNLLRGSVLGYQVGVAPPSAGAALRYAFIPAVFDDGMYQLAPKGARASGK